MIKVLAMGLPIPWPTLDGHPVRTMNRNPQNLKVN
jgi:hypothetical protein